MIEEQSLSLSTFPYFHIPALCHHWEIEILKGNLWTTCLTSNSSHKRVSMIKLVNPKGNQPSIFIGRTDAEAPILWPPDVKNWLIGKDPDAGEDWRQEEKGTTEDEMVGGITYSMHVSVSKLRETVKDRDLLQFMGLQRVRHDWTTEQQQNLAS